MPIVSVSVPHDKDPDEVVQRAGPYVEKLIDDFEGHDLDLEWSGRQAEFTFKSMAFRISGNVEVDEKQISVGVDLPIMAMMFKDKVEKAIHKNLSRALSDEQPAGEDAESSAD